MPKFTRIILVVLFLFCTIAIPPLVHAGPALVIPVEISAQTYGPIGSDLVKQTTDLFRSSSRFQLATAMDTNKFIIRISTMEYQQAKDPAKIIAYSLSITALNTGDFYAHYITSTVGMCTAQEVPADARAILNDFTTLIVTQPDLVTSIQRPRVK